MWYKINFGTVSWIDPKHLPSTGLHHLAFTKEHMWVVKAVMGLTATANYTPPPGSLPDVADYQPTRAYRALTSGYVELEVDPKTKAIRNLDMFRLSVANPGWTPPFARSKFKYAALDPSVWDRDYHSGELSPLSQVMVGKRHPNGILGTSAGTGEQTVAHALLKVRAGAHVDDLGLSKVGAPFHVPWVWCELLLTYDQRQARLKLYGVGSIFPSHAWYLAGEQRFTTPQIGDNLIPGVLFPAVEMVVGGGPVFHNFLIRPEQMNLYRVFRKGSLGIGPQTSLASESSQSAGPVTSHVYTVEAGKVQVFSVGLETLKGTENR